jgi:hypothetical protein
MYYKGDSLFPTYCTSSHIQTTPKCFGHTLWPSSGSTFINTCCTLQLVFCHLPKRLLYFKSIYDLSVKRNPWIWPQKMAETRRTYLYIWTTAVSWKQTYLYTYKIIRFNNSLLQKNRYNGYLSCKTAVAMDRFRPKWHLGTLHSIHVTNFCQITSSTSGDDPTYSTMGTAALSGGKAAGAWRWPPPNLSAGLKKGYSYTNPLPPPRANMAWCMGNFTFKLGRWHEKADMYCTVRIY